MNKVSQIEPVPYDDGAGRGRGSPVDAMSSPAAPKNRWVMLAFAFVATVINYLDRQTLSVLAPVLLERFKISATTYSHIIFAFMLAYTVMNGVSGPLLDRLGTKVGYTLTIAWWSAAEILSAFSAGALSLGIFRFLLGVGEAGNYPAGVKVIGEWFPPQERSLASGIFNSGAAIGAMLAPPLLAWTVLEMGWQASFVVVGALGFVWLGAWTVYSRAPPINPGEVESPPPAVWALAKTRFVWQFTLSKVFADPVWYFYTFWFPQYLKVAHGFTMKEIGQTAWIPFFTAGIGNLAGGFLCSGLLRIGLPAQIARRVGVLIFSGLMVAAVPSAMVHSSALAIALISTATFGYCGALANVLAIPRDLFPKNAVASIWGLASMGSGFGGMVFSLVTGWLVDQYSFKPAFVLFGLTPIISACLIWWLPRTLPPTLRTSA
ncbi:MAG TPA: MFS transporter [Acidobacteriaceae bacterium]|jgi:ACS family hexuronate transporter-like MFS transporter|nr:MFS transporter [Acidobacteriaceae bacterium]